MGYHRSAEHTAKLQHPGRDIQGSKDSTSAEDVPFAEGVALFITDAGVLQRSEEGTQGIGLRIAVCHLLYLRYGIVMFNVEPQYNPETGEATFATFFDALYWSAVTLTTVGYGDMCPATDAGRMISMLSAIFGIAIIALPSGIITASYIEELKALKNERMTERLRKAFRKKVSRANDYHPRYMLVPKNVSVATLLVKYGLTMEQIVESLESAPEFRLRNMATAMPESQHPNDRIVVEHFHVNRPYGCMINRNSRVTIAATTNRNEAGIGSFSYYLALIGGFNYISKEIDRDNDESVSFYNIEEPV